MVPQHDTTPELPIELRAVLATSESEASTEYRQDSTPEAASAVFAYGRAAVAAIVESTRDALTVMHEQGADISLLIPLRALADYGQALLDSTVSKAVDEIRATLSRMCEQNVDEILRTPLRVLVIHGQTLLDSYGVTVETFFAFTEDAKEICAAIEHQLGIS